MSRYAKNTTVASEKTRGDIERLLDRYGADQFGYGWGHEGAMIGFRLGGRAIRFLLPLPAKDAHEFTHTPSTDQERKPAAARKAWEQATRSMWRALLLVVKAKLEAVEAGITTLDQEFLAHILLPSGETVGEFAIPQIEQGARLKGLPMIEDE